MEHPGINWSLTLKGRKTILALFCAFLVGLAIGLICMHAARPDDKCRHQDADNRTYYEVIQPHQSFNSANLQKKIIERIDKQRLKEDLRFLTKEPHIAGLKRDEELAIFIRDKFNEIGFDHSQMVPYNVLLSYPNKNMPNKITLTQSGRKIFESHHMEEPIHADDMDPNFVHAFNAYAPAGSVTTNPGIGVVYVNYGRIEDFKKLKQLGVNITGHVAMVRYGKIYRGNKVKHAEDFGAVGVIIFSDPEDVAAEGTSPNDVYDNTFWLPGTGIQRGSAFIGFGDPRSPGWPSTEHAYRIPVEEAVLPKIPAQPIGYSDAEEILKHLDGQVAPEEWQGGMSNLRYRLGPSFKSYYTDVSLSLTTHNTLNVTKNYNVIGIIKGSVEPDRYVILGNHRDAWGYGSVDPSSGTTQFLEVARVFGSFMKEGWRPRRTIILASWGAEEHGLIGSTEWVEEHINKLSYRTVAHINTDACVSGTRFYVASGPLLWDVAVDVSKMVPSASDAKKTLFEEWVEYDRLYYPDEEEYPVFEALGSGSDHAPFSFLAGIPAMRLEYRVNKNDYNISTYPSYHTGYETFHMYSKIIDPEFRLLQTCGRMTALMLTHFSESHLLPYGIERLPRQMMKGLKDFKHRQLIADISSSHSNQFMMLEESVAKLQVAADKFKKNIQDVTSAKNMNPLILRGINDQLMKLEHIFIMPTGLPERSSKTELSALISPGQFDGYSSSVFPGLSDLMQNYKELFRDAEKVQREKEIQRHISDLMIMTDRAASLLKDLHLV